MSSAAAAVVGAGIAGVAAAYHLAVHEEITDVVILDPRPPLSLTSDKSTECYRNWWPTAPMVELMNRSIDILEQLDAVHGFGLTRRGYLYVTASEAKMAELTDQASAISALGGGDVRHHQGEDGYRAAERGADILDREALAAAFPFLTDHAVGAVHVRRAGWFGAQQLGAWMLEAVKARGGRLREAEVVGIDTDDESVAGVVTADGDRISTRRVVLAAGPMSAELARTVGLDLPLITEAHHKVAFRDHLGAIPRDAPMIIWSDPQEISWSTKERVYLKSAGRHDLIGALPPFCHGRPEGGSESPYFVALWEYDRRVLEPIWPIPVDPLYPEVVLRGLSTMVPGLERYHDRLPPSSVDGGYYVKTPDNRPLIGGAGPDGLYLLGGMSGFGVMAAAGAGELAAAHVAGSDLPAYAEAFEPARFDDPAYRSRDDLSSTGQL